MLLYAFLLAASLHVCFFPQPHKGSQKKAKIPRAAGKMPVTNNDNKFVEIRHNDQLLLNSLYLFVRVRLPGA